MKRPMGDRKMPAASVTNDNKCHDSALMNDKMIPKVDRTSSEDASVVSVSAVGTGKKEAAEQASCRQKQQWHNESKWRMLTCTYFPCIKLGVSLLIWKVSVLL